MSFDDLLLLVLCIGALANTATLVLVVLTYQRNERKRCRQRALDAVPPPFDWPAYFRGEHQPR